jgi:hypothetical protein
VESTATSTERTANERLLPEALKTVAVEATPQTRGRAVHQVNECSRARRKIETCHQRGVEEGEPQPQRTRVLVRTAYCRYRYC